MHTILMLSQIEVGHIRIAIAALWTAASIVAAVFHAFNWREAAKNQHAVRGTGPLGMEIAKMLVRMEQDRFLKMAILASVGIGALAGQPYASLVGWGLLALPVIGIWGSIVDRQSRSRQAAIVEAQLAKTLVARKITVERGADGTVIAKPDISPPK